MNPLRNDSAWIKMMNSILELLTRTAELEKQVAALKEFNRRFEPVNPVPTPADIALEADLQAARGVKPAYKSDVQRIMELKGFIMDILSPEMYGHAVTREVRNAARRVLGIDSQE